MGMPARYAPAKVVYQELRAGLTPWAKANAFHRWPGTVAGWRKALDPERALCFRFEGSSAFASADTGHSLTGWVQIEPPSGGVTATPIRQALFTSCLLRPELDRLARIQGAINQRRPSLPAQFERDARQDSLLGRYLRELYESSPEYQEGQYIPLSYYCIEDVREFVRFIAGTLAPVLDRFVEGRNPAPIDTTPSHLKPKWVGGIR